MIYNKKQTGALSIDNNHIFATNGARDTYFATNPSELKDGVVIQVGSGFEKYQAGTTTWNSITALVKGSDGTAATIAVGTVTTGVAGSSATVTNVGTSANAIFDFTIPKGDTGSGGGGSATWGGITGTLSAQTDLNSALSAKQATLVSGTNIKTVNGTSLLGSGNIVISGGAGAVDSVNTKTGVVTLNQDEIPDGTTYKQYSQTEKTKLAGIATGAQVNTSKVKASATDTTEGYLGDKLVAGTNVTITKNNSGVNETYTIASTASGGSGVTVYADLTAIKAVDTTSYTTTQTVQVTSLGLYKFQPSSTLTGDDVNVITPTAGSSAGRWIKQSADYSTITSNVIDPATSGGTITGTIDKNINTIKENAEVLISKKTRPTKTRKILFLGSSVCSGLGATVFADSYQSKIMTALANRTDVTFTSVNKCVGGSTTANVISRFISDVVPENPDLVFIGLSTNNEALITASDNQTAGVVAKAFKKRIATIVRLCEQYGYDYLLGGEYSYTGSTANGYQAKATLNHQLSKQYENKYINWLGNVAVDDTFDFKTGTSTNNGHPNTVGYANMYNAINLDLFENIKHPVKNFVAWAGSAIVTLAQSYLARLFFGYESSTVYNTLTGYTITFDHCKGSAGGNSVTLMTNLNKSLATAVSIKIDANGYYVVYNASTLVTTTSILADKNIKRNIIVRADNALSLVKVYIDGVEVSSFTPTNGCAMRQLYLANDSSTSGSSAVGHEFSNLIVYRNTIDSYGIKQIARGDYPQSVIEYCHTLNFKETEYTLFSENGTNDFIQLAATQSWGNTYTGDNIFTNTEKTKIANSLNGTFTTVDGKTITITGGMVTSIV